MKYYYDFHIHTALSPCAEDEMTPNNIVNMALVNGLDMIAVTDHNSAKNLAAVGQCALDKGLLLVPGIEVESAEEVHVSCLFPTVAAAEDMGRFVAEHLPPLKNKEEIFGPQYIFDWQDKIIGKEEQMLLISADLTVEEIFPAAEELGGCAYFSHVDRESYSALSVLGTLPPDIGASVIEISDTVRGWMFAAARQDLGGLRVLCSSDCHRLADMGQRSHFINLPAATAKNVVNWIKDMR